MFTLLKEGYVYLMEVNYSKLTNNGSVNIYKKKNVNEIMCLVVYKKRQSNQAKNPTKTKNPISFICSYVYNHVNIS